MTTNSDPRTAALAELAAAADRDGSEIALIGSYALELWGCPRPARDVDVLIRDQAPWDARGDVIQYVTGRATSGLLIDVILCGGPNRRLLEETLAAARSLPPCPIPVATLPHLAALGYAAQKPKDRESILWILRSGLVDPALVKAVIERHFTFARHP